MTARIRVVNVVEPGSEPVVDVGRVGGGGGGGVLPVPGMSPATTGTESAKSKHVAMIMSLIKVSLRKSLIRRGIVPLAP
jgi:hypothetical protein